MPTAASTTGYCTEIGALQCRHLPVSSNHDRSGMLSYHAMAAPHAGHLERGRTNDSLLGSRTIHTLRKLPRISPTMAALTRTTRSTSTLHLVENDPRRDRHVERLRAPRHRDRH